MLTRLKICLLLTVITVCPLAQAKPPKFKDYPARVYTGPLAKPNVNSNPRSSNYRTTIRNAAAEAPNFAGHYHLAVWGCGVDCIGFAIADAASSKVYHPINEVVSDISWCLSNGDIKDRILADSKMGDTDTENDKLYFLQ